MRRLGSSVPMAALWLTMATVAHAMGLTILPDVPPSTIAPRDDVDVELVSIPDTEPEVVEEPEPVLEEEPEPIVERKLRTPKPPPKPPEEPEEKPPAAAEETPVEFDNIVLTNENNKASGWSTADGSGKDKEGPVGSPNAAVTGESARGQAGGVLGGTGDGIVVDVGDLSRQPRPPNVTRKLKRNYPAKARSESIEGYGEIRLQVGSNGMPSRFKVVGESPKGYGFGAACVKTMRGEKWRPPVDQNGRRVATRLNFRCDFAIRY